MSEKNIKLVIAEKPSVAQSIAKVIGADKREDGYLEGNGYIVGFARTGAEAETESPMSDFFTLSLKSTKQLQFS